MNETRPPARRTPLNFADARRLVLFVALLLVAWLLMRALVAVLLLFAIVFLLAMILNPVVVWLERHRIPRPVSVALLLLAIISLVAGIAAFVVPAVIDQLGSLAHSAPRAWDSVRSRFGELSQRFPVLQNALPAADQLANTIGAQAGAAANILLRSTIGFVGGLFVFVFALLLLVFVLANPQPLVLAYLALVPERQRPAARRTLVRLMDQMVAWARGVAINGAIAGTSTGLLLWLVGVQPALLFGAIAFAGEFLPNIGPVIVALPVLFVALSISATKFWLALGVILFVQQIEANFLVPIILGRSMRLNAVSILFFTLAMGWLFGLAGAVLALPAAALTQIVIEEFYLRPRRLDYQALGKDAGLIVRGEASAAVKKELS